MLKDGKSRSGSCITAARAALICSGAGVGLPLDAASRPYRLLSFPPRPCAREFSPATPTRGAPATKPKPRLHNRDRILWVGLRNFWPEGWTRQLRIVQPETVVGWHREGWRLYWTWRSRTRRTRRSGVCCNGKADGSATSIGTLEQFTLKLVGAQRNPGAAVEAEAAGTDRSSRRWRGYIGCCAPTRSG
jgi:hypothetical protein